MDRRINGAPAVYTAVPLHIYPERIPFTVPPTIPDHGETNETDARICVVCGQCRMYMKAQNARDPHWQKEFRGMYGDTCRACAEGAKRTPKKEETKKRARKAASADDGVPF